VASTGHTHPFLAPYGSILTLLFKSELAPTRVLWNMAGKMITLVALCVLKAEMAESLSCMALLVIPLEQKVVDLFLAGVYFNCPFCADS
jgi:hypothetical protein